MLVILTFKRWNRICWLSRVEGAGGAGARIGGAGGAVSLASERMNLFDDPKYWQKAKGPRKRKRTGLFVDCPEHGFQELNLGRYSGPLVELAPCPKCKDLSLSCRALNQVAGWKWNRFHADYEPIISFTLPPEEVIALANADRRREDRARKRAVAQYGESALINKNPRAHRVPYLEKLMSRSAFHGQRCVYKFFQSVHKTDVLERGSIKLGTLFEYSRGEPPHADPSERRRRARVGAFMSEPELYGHSQWAGDPPFRFLQQGQAIGRGRLIASNVVLTDHVDAFVYCYSYKNDPKTAESLKAASGADFDCLAEIDDVEALAEDLVHHHPAITNYDFIYGPVTYTDDSLPDYYLPSKRIIKAFTKPRGFAGNPTGYADNHEGRIVFFPSWKDCAPLLSETALSTKDLISENPDFLRHFSGV